MKIIKIILVLLVISFHSKADVIFDPYIETDILWSLEGIGSYEFPFSGRNTINIWGGAGFVSTFGEIENPAFGGESALELRHYFKKNDFKGFNLGIYTGLAVMRSPEIYGGKVVRHENSVGFVPGVKLTYKKWVNSWLVGEPYIGISTPWYGDNLKEAFKNISNQEPGFIFTIGLRIGFNKVKVWK